MVLAGQFLERPTLIPTAEGLVLEGLAHRGSRRPGLLVLSPPPAEGGSMDHVVGMELAYAVTHAGFPTLRFNYRGVGASQGARAKAPGPMLEDARAALELARENMDGVEPAVVAIGASDALALALAKERSLPAVAFVNPTLVAPREAAALAARVPVVVVAGALDEAVDRPAFADALAGGDGRFEVVPGASRTYQRNLPLVGKAVVELLLKVESKR